MARKRTNQTDLSRYYIGGTTFYFPKDITQGQYNERVFLVRKLFEDVGDKWDEISKDIAKRYVRGEKLINISLKNRKPDPSVQSLLKLLTPIRNSKVAVSSDHFSYSTPTDEDSVRKLEAINSKRNEATSTTYDELLSDFPNVNFDLPKDFIQEKEKEISSRLKELQRVSRIELEQNAVGTFHEAMDKYIEYRSLGFIDPKYGKVTGSGNHFISILKAVKEHNPDFPLYSLGLTRLNALFEPYVQRKGDITKKTATNYIGEIKRFLKWLALNESVYGWSYPKNYELMTYKVKNLPSDSHSKPSMEIEVFKPEEIKILLENATPFEKLIILICVNCSFGPAEIGRLTWGEITFGYHRWISEGLNLDSDLQENSFIIGRRVKSRVVGSWLLWKECVESLQWWRTEWIKFKNHEPSPEDRVLITSTGGDFYRECTRNGASSFGNMWSRILKRCDGKVKNLSIGALRKQLPDFLTDRPTLASVALCHGTPHKGDKILYKHYANKPWNALFKAQLEFRQHLGFGLEVKTDNEPSA